MTVMTFVACSSLVLIHRTMMNVLQLSVPVQVLHLCDGLADGHRVLQDRGDAAVVVEDAARHLAVAPNHRRLAWQKRPPQSGSSTAVGMRRPGVRSFGGEGNERRNASAAGREGQRARLREGAGTEEQHRAR